MMDESSSLDRFHRVILIQGAVTLLVFTILTATALLLFRDNIQHQILARDGILLTSMTEHFHKRASQNDAEFALLDVILDSSELEDVIGVRLFSPFGKSLATIPSAMNDASLSSADLNQLNFGEPVITFHHAMQMDSLFSDIEALVDEGSYPVTRICAPIFENGQLTAVIEYWLDSATVASELHNLDQFLVIIGACFIIGGGIVFFIVFYVSRKRLMKMGSLLAEQNRSLQKANANLSMAARTSAIGSISSHLFHGLRNPLAGLKAYLQVSGHDEEVLEMTSRMQALIDESLAVLKEEEDLYKHSLSSDELSAVAEKRLASGYESVVKVKTRGEGMVPAHKVQLLLLVMRNLVENAVEVSTEPVQVEFHHLESGLEATVSDSGPGLPDHVREHLFEPVKSTKQNGAGIGLAISAVIARHIPATLYLAKSDAGGTRFIVKIPR